ncbi:Protein of unknown function (DUF2889) [Parafrankia irregularis]|uniref:DUF2889 domain-containing protein n=1 Tax=Parafrankia irregularis TaxID=795642 RepID=A0A0S4QDF4_9ACTN|nr:DUF2889 domain-containing protein [Parafrankia sp. CH37]CUU53524.1 Protein of unknown function (DUF2889) [Parafrankia irregularis]
MAHGQTAPSAAQASPLRPAPGRPVPRVPSTGRPRSVEDGTRPGGVGVRHAATGRRPVTAAPDDSGLWPGTTGSVHGTPARQPGSVRRTISVMMERPQGLTGLLHLTSTGRDLMTTSAGGATVLGEARLRLVIDYMAAPGTILEIESEPAVPGLASLVGAPSRAGFRAAARQVLAAQPDSTAHPEDSAQGTARTAMARLLLGQLLDDVPVTVLVSGAALGRNGIHRSESRPNAGAESGGNPMIDVCAGWQREGLLARLSAERRADRDAGGSGDQDTGDRTSPARPISVPAGDLAVAEDPLGWHPLPPMSTHAMRRLRRIDVVPAPGTPGAAVRVDALLRDSYLESPGREFVVHEYGVDADVDEAGLFTRSVARAGVLPGAECPEALGSAGRIVGMPATDLRRTIGRTFVGTSTCTHLNDTLRALGDLPVLIGFLGEPSTD